MKNRYVIVSETRGVIANHSSLDKIRALRIEEERKYNENCYIFKEVKNE